MVGGALGEDKSANDDSEMFVLDRGFKCLPIPGIFPSKKARRESWSCTTFRLESLLN